VPLTNEALKIKLFNMLDECNEQLSKYKELRSKGMMPDKTFEAILSTRKQVISDILDLITQK
jgi:hypothetical protein